ncbi:AraC family transcriptional regulator [Novosphingobium mangrovi (ex Hu et al. 2023)]|uniref:AraC family transcriptional regulator n=1 Tax=Novosphingobium mangrovi (ex Hu et al. 2023) TaxID=2930094 RepID=A0ABT0AG53_9SPHN|nr:helix-turn-helix domain-containing protein [Novosphingobium mangrovi (ex Hu et al. 2023)]MCJ1962175.1 AraC family transcriptional regulator [Novosphingobium mangrovi (ex Hu et al. 2023)]
MYCRSGQEFSTEHVAPPLRTRRWSEFGSETLSEMTVRARSDSGLRAHIHRRNLGPLGFVVVTSSAAEASSSAACPGPWAREAEDCLMLTVLDHGRSSLSQSRWSADLETGDIVIRDLNKPWISRSDADVGLILIKIPYSVAARSHPDPERLVGRHLSAADPRVAFASDVIRASKRALQAVDEESWNARLGPVLENVFHMICHEGPAPLDGEPCSGHRSLHRAATSFIARNLADPDLSVGGVAKALGVSTRHLQRAFLDSGTSPREFILQQRLAEAARLLRRNQGAQRQRITDIAFSLGFGDASHFTRAFTRHFGTPPSAYRADAT